MNNDGSISFTSGHLKTAYYYFNGAFVNVKSAVTWVGVSNQNACSVLENVPNLFLQLDQMYDKLQECVDIYNRMQTFAGDMAECRYIISQIGNGFVDKLQYEVAQMKYKSKSRKYEQELSNFNSVRKNINYITINSNAKHVTKDSSIFDYPFSVCYETLDRIRNNLELCIYDLEQAVTDCENILNKVNSKPSTYSNYYNCLPFPSANFLSIFKSNIIKIKNIIQKSKTCITNFKTNISEYEKGNTIDLGEIDGKENNVQNVPETQPIMENETYVVKPGDYLSKIAREYGVSTEELYEANKDIIGDNPNLIKIGQTFVIPGKLVAATVEDKPEIDDASDSKDLIKQDKLSADDYKMNTINRIISFDSVPKTNWNIECEQTDLEDLSNPLGNKTLKVNCFPTKEIIADDYTYSTWVNNGTYKGNHYGSDFAASYDDVYSISEGIVVSTGYETSGGNYVIILNEIINDDGTVSYYTTRYLHLSNNNKVKVGDVVTPETVIAVSGATGSKCQGPHLHVEMGKVNISAEDMAECEGPKEIVNLYKNNSKVVGNSWIDLGSYYYETDKALYNAANGKRRK